VIAGDFTQGSDGTLDTVALSDNDWGQLQIAGKANLSGDLEITLVGGYTPMAPFEKNIIGATGGVVGRLTPPAGWRLDYPGNNFVVVIR
jgi:hypothetical protein